MRAHFDTDPTLFARCMDLIDEVFPGCKQMAYDGIKYHACWNKASTPFILEDKGKVIAHVGVWPLEFLLNGKLQQSASIHGVCVKKEYRGQGLYKQLMQEALAYAKNITEFTILFTDKPDLYTHYNFKIIPQFDFELNTKDKIISKTDLRILKLTKAADLTLIENLLSDHIPLSNQMSLPKEKNIFILNMLRKNIYYSPSLHVIIAYEVIDNHLYIQDIISQTQYDLPDILKLIPDRYDKIILQFCPDKFTSHSFTPIPAKTECMMASDNFNFSGNAFRYPEPYHC